MLTARQREAVALREEGLSFAQMAKRMGLDKAGAHKHYKAAQAKLDGKKARLDPGVHGVLDRLGMGDLSGQHTGWVHRQDEKTGEWASVYYYLGADGAPGEADLEEMIGAAVKRATTRRKARPVRPVTQGHNLLVIDIADLHIGKLCVKSETGFSYDAEEAVRRGIEGTRRLIERAMPYGIGHVLFVLGNDRVHIDRPTGQTTSGTPQDTAGTLATMWEDAFSFDVAAIDQCRQVAPVSLLYCPSNHDWISGYTLARALRAWYRDCPEVSASDYNTSHRHRKYFRFAENLLGFTHGDGAKDADLPALMLEEAAEHLGEARRRYWYLHHLHHKIRKRGAGADRARREKDLIGMTVIGRALDRPAGLEELEIEHVRSPSPPDGWHDRNGYVNRQAVEAFLHDPHAGQVARFTEWF